MVSTSSLLSRPIGLSSISGVMRPFIVDEDQLLDLGDHADLGARVERVAEQLVELGAEGGERADQGAGVLVEETVRGAGDLVDRVGDAGLEARFEVVERALDHVDVDGDVGGPQSPGADAQALADRRQRVVGLGDDADDLGVVLLELTRRRRCRRRRGPVPGCRWWLRRSCAFPRLPWRSLRQGRASIRQGCDINVGPLTGQGVRPRASTTRRAEREACRRQSYRGSGR